MGNSFNRYHASLTVSAVAGVVGYVAGACDPEMKYRANVKARLVLAFEEIADAIKNPTMMGLAIANHRRGLIVAARNGALLCDADARFAGLVVVEEEVIIVDVVSPATSPAIVTAPATTASFAAFIGQ
jgi:putative intracellular protease/amidase